MKPELGTEAPDVALSVIGGDYLEETEVRFADFIGQNVVVYFYPKDNTPGCTTQACGLRDSWEMVKEKAVVFGVSPDSIRMHSNFIKKQELPFALISDKEKQLVEHFGVWVEKKMYGKVYMGVERSTFIFNKEGKLQTVLEKVKPADHVGLVLDALK